MRKSRKARRTLKNREWAPAASVGLEIGMKSEFRVDRSIVESAGSGLVDEVVVFSALDL